MLKKILVLVLIASIQTIMAMQDYTIKLGRESYTVTQDFINQCKTLQVIAENTRKPESQNITEPTKLNLTKSMSQAQFLAIQPHVTALKNLLQPPNNIAIALSDESQTSLINLVDLAKAAYYLEVSLLLPVLSQELKKRLHDPWLRKFLLENDTFARQFLQELSRPIRKEAAVTQSVRNCIMDLGTQHATTLYGHKDSVLSLVPSKDGNYLFSASSDQTIRIWDVSDPNNARCIKILTGHEDWVRILVLSNDGTLLFSGSNDATIRIWDVSDPNNASCIKTLTGHEKLVRALVLSNEGIFLFSGSHDNAIRIWNVSNPNNASCIKILPDHEDCVNTLVSSKDGNYLFSGSSDKTIRIWDVSNPNNASCIKTLTGHEGVVPALVLSNDSNYLFSASTDITIRIWNVSNPINAACIKTLTGCSNWAFTLLLSNDGNYLFAGSSDTTIRIWNTCNFNEIPCIKTLFGRHVYALVLSNDSNYLFSAGYDDTIRIWQLPNFELFERSMLLEHAHLLEEIDEAKKAGTKINLTGPENSAKLAWYKSMHTDLKEMAKPHCILPAELE